MFQTEIKVEGKYVRGTIKKVNNTYKLFSELNIGNNRENQWNDEQLEGIAEEFKQTADKIDAMNNPVYQDMKI